MRRKGLEWHLSSVSCVSDGDDEPCSSLLLVLAGLGRSRDFYCPPAPGTSCPGAFTDVYCKERPRGVA